MHIWVDADACPAVIKEILYRAARRTGLKLTLVANQALAVPADANITALQVGSGFDVADDEIVARCQAGDLVITADIPLAAELLAKQARVLNPRGEVLTSGNIGARLNMRDFMETMRASGAQTGGPPPFSQRDRKAFAEQLDKLLARLQAASP